MKPMKTLSESIICCFGDSTTWGDNGCGAGGNDISWTTHLGALLGGVTVENFGIKGSRIAVKADRTDSFVERLDGIDDAADIYIVFGGVNDFSRNVPLGELGSTDVHEFYGAVDYLIRTITARSPQARLVFMTPCKTSGKHEKDIPASDEANHLADTRRLCAGDAGGLRPLLGAGDRPLCAKRHQSVFAGAPRALHAGRSALQPCRL